MKKIIVLLSVCLLFAFFGYTQTIPAEKVPATVKESFVKKFPAATSVVYKMKKKDYKVTFKKRKQSGCLPISIPTENGWKRKPS